MLFIIRFLTIKCTLICRSLQDIMFSATSRFIVLNNLHIKMADCGRNNVYDDPAVTIHYVPLLVEQTDQESHSGDQYEIFDYFHVT